MHISYRINMISFFQLYFDFPLHWPKTFHTKCLIHNLLLFSDKFLIAAFTRYSSFQIQRYFEMVSAPCTQCSSHAPILHCSTCVTSVLCCLFKRITIFFLFFCTVCTKPPLLILYHFTCEDNFSNKALKRFSLIIVRVISQFIF